MTFFMSCHNFDMTLYHNFVCSQNWNKSKSWDTNVIIVP